MRGTQLEHSFVKPSSSFTMWFTVPKVILTILEITLCLRCRLSRIYWHVLYTLHCMWSSAVHSESSYPAHSTCLCSPSGFQIPISASVHTYCVMHNTHLPVDIDWSNIFCFQELAHAVFTALSYSPTFRFTVCILMVPPAIWWWRPCRLRTWRSFWSYISM